MQLYYSFLVKKYAIAFNNLYGARLTAQDLEACEKLRNFFVNNRYCYIALGIPSIPLEIKKQMMDILLNKFLLKKGFHILAYELLKRGRIEFLDKILLRLYHEYNKRHGIELLKIISSHPLSKQQQEITARFVQSISKYKIMTGFVVDPKLIVGLRVQSATSLWERSIRKELTDISTIIAQKGMP